MTDQSQDTRSFTPPPDNSIPPEPPEFDPDFEQRRGCGCWVTLLTTLTVFVVLVVVGLFLPPVSLYQRLFSPNYVTLTASANAVGENGFTLAAYNLQGGATLGVSLSSVPMDRFLAGDTSAGAWDSDARAAVPPSLALQSPVYSVEASNNAADVTLGVDLPANVNPDVLDLYGWSTQTKTWTFIPAHPADGRLIGTVSRLPDHVALFQAAPISQPSVLASVDVTQMLSSGVGELATIVAPAGLQPTADGKLVGNLAAGFDLNAGYLVNSGDPQLRRPACHRSRNDQHDLEQRRAPHDHASQIAAFASSYDGVLIDYRDLPADLSDEFTAFISDLSQQLHQAGLLLIVAVPTASNGRGTWDTGAVPLAHAWCVGRLRADQPRP